MMQLCEPGALVAVVEHFAEHRDFYAQHFAELEKQSAAIQAAFAAASGDARA